MRNINSNYIGQEEFLLSFKCEIKELNKAVEISLT